MTKKALDFLVKILFYIFVVLFLVYLFVQMRHFGYLIFADRAKDQPEIAKEVILTVEEGESLLSIAKDLAKQEVVENPYVFALSLRCQEGYAKIQAGEYVIQSSQKPSEILKTLTGEEETQS